MNDIRYYTDGTQATAVNLNKPLEDLNKQGQYMSKAEFDSLAEMRRNTYAGSGLANPGIYGKTANHIRRIDNEDLFIYNDVSTNNFGFLVFGGDARKSNSLYNINGTIHKISSGPDWHTQKIKFPDAPTLSGTITGDEVVVGKVVVSGTITGDDKK